VVNKCANSTCEVPFLYFRGGKLFQFPVADRAAVEAFWLCGDCSRELTLQWRTSQGVVAVPISTAKPLLRDDAGRANFTADDRNNKAHP
jgi:hypothetical protein